MVKEKIREKYAMVEGCLDDALKKSQSIQLDGEEENKELEAIITTLEEINTDFKTEIEKLEASSEWDKYCVAFFGETNAGKSTIIESLRIIFDEEYNGPQYSDHSLEKISEHGIMDKKQRIGAEYHGTKALYPSV